MQYDLTQLTEAARYLIEQSGGARVWCFVGEMGAGKTTLIKSVCHELGVKEGLSSPTFAIVNVYQGASSETVYHFDFYRIEDPLEVVQLGVEEYFDSGSYCFIEWPDRIVDFLPEEYLKINVKLVSAKRRELTVYHV